MIMLEVSFDMVITYLWKEHDFDDLHIHVLYIKLLLLLANLN